MDWHDYEKFVFGSIKEHFPDSEVEFNCELLGKYSQGLRQCDVLVKQKVCGVEEIILVDAKYYSKKLDVKDVEEFISMANDVNATRGILVTPMGYSELAYSRAENDPSKIVLEILSLEELKLLQGQVAIIYSGRNSVLIRAALGWVIDGKCRENMAAVCYRQGFDFERAAKEREFIYFNFWDKAYGDVTPLSIITEQARLVQLDYPTVETSFEELLHIGKKVAIRKTVVTAYPAIEYACAIDHDDFIFFGVMFSPRNRESVNGFKLIQMTTQAIQLHIE